ncbi:MAG: hypothetical protein ACT4PG_09320 [Panacagrimonas sp.]
MVVFDATFLMLLVDPAAAPPLDPATNKPVTQAKLRIEHLLSELQKSGERVGVPTPALSEVLVGAAGPIHELVTELTAGYKLKTLAFDELAAIEVALMTDRALTAKGAVSDETKARVKYDRQIIAIARVAGADAIYTDDLGLRKKAHSLGMRTVGLEDVALPPEQVQGTLSLPEPPEIQGDHESTK